jgi:hypothetical protein
MFQLNPNAFGSINSKSDYDRQKAELKRQKQMGDLQLLALQKQVNAKDQFTPEQLLAKAIQLGGVQNLTPEEQAQLQAADISQRTKQTVDSRGNIITNQSYFDLLGSSPSQVLNQPTSVMRGQGIVPEVGQSAIDVPRMGQRGDSGMVSPNIQTVPNTGNFLDIASMPDDLAMEGSYLPPVNNSLPMPDVSGLSPFAAEDVLKEWKLENMKRQGQSADTANQKKEEAPKAELAFNSMRDDTQNMINTIDKAIENTSGWTAGFGTFLSSVPASGAKNLEATLSTIQADSAFSTLQAMRDASPTGGALGAISERELALLQNARVALDQSQSPDELKSNLENYKRIRTQALKNTADGFKLDYGYYPKGLDKFLDGKMKQQDTQGGWSIKKK